MIDGTGRWCGTRGGYTNHGCRCALCTAAHANYQRKYMASHDEQREKHRQYMRRLRQERAPR